MHRIAAVRAGGAGILYNGGTGNPPRGGREDA